MLAGPSERRRLEAMSTVETRVLADGPRENVLLRVALRTAPRSEEPGASS